MKLTVMLMIIACLQVSARGFSQSITLNLKNATLETVFSEIRKSTHYNFIYTRDEIKKAPRVGLHVANAKIEDVLALCFKDLQLTYTIVDSFIIVKRKEASLYHGDKETYTNIEIIGKVINEQDEPIEGVTVTIGSSRKIVLSDRNGQFILTNIGQSDVLYFSSVGYEPSKITINNQQSLLIKLKIALKNLDATVVIGYGITSKRFNTGNVTTVTGDEIQKQPVSNPLAAIEGRVPGMLITQNTGAPNANYTIQIRGQNSISNGNDPLYIVDGVPYLSQLLPNLNTTGRGGNPLNFINPSDIESIDVLKDADATSIYGSRGANGVILITTKKGRPGKITVDFNTYMGIGKVGRTVDYLNTQQYLEMRHEAFANDGATPQSWDYDINGTWDTTRYTDWQKMLIGGTAHYTNAQISVSGGNANTQYLIGGGYRRETTVFPGNLSAQKASMHFNINSKSSNQKFKIQLSGSYLADISNLVYGDFTSKIQYLPPNAPEIHNPDGTLNWANSTWPDENPFAELEQRYKGRTNNLVANGIVSYEILKNLELKTSIGYTNMQINEKNTIPTTFYNPAFNVTSGSSYFNTINSHSWIAEPQINYRLKLGSGKLSALIGATFQQADNEAENLYATGFTSDALLENIQAATAIHVQQLISTQYKYNAIFGRLNYNWKEKYLLTLTARRDGSSRFGPGKQFANFGSIGAAWIFSNEDFIQHNLPFISFGKLRASYGTTGNDQLQDYRFLDLFANSSYPYQNTQGLYPTNLFNPDLAWEVNKKMEYGLELGFLKNRVMVNASYFRNRSSNQLVSYALSAVTGFTSIAANLPAKVQNSGLELILTSVNVQSKNFNWSSSFNITVHRNKLVAYPNIEASPYNNTYIIGQPLSITRLFHFTSVNPQTGVYQFVDSKGNSTDNPVYPDDLTTYLNTAPKFYGGFQNTFQFKGFTLDVFFQFVKQTGQEFLYNVLPGSFGYNQPVSVLNRWQKTGDVTNIQKFNQDFSLLYPYLNARLYSDQLFADASFIRLKNVSLSYQLPVKLIQKMHIDNFRVYFQAQNLLTITKYKGYDPENQSNTNLPPLRVLTMGLQITL